jgi:hypothetical protein
VNPDFTTDRWLAKRQIPNVYNCFDFTRDVWKDLTGDDIGDRLQILQRSIPDRRVSRSDLTAFRRLNGPESPSLVMMRSRRATPHIGVYLNGRILHLRQRGAIFEPVIYATMGFSNIGYYR